MITITVDGTPTRATTGDTVASVLLAGGRRSWRITSTGQPRGVFCGIGMCFDCTLTVDGVTNVRACTARVRDGMRVETDPSW